MISLLFGVAVPGIMSAFMAMEALAASHKLVLRGSDAMIVDPSLIGLLNHPSGARVLPLALCVDLVFVDFASEADGVGLDRTNWFLWFGYRYEWFRYGCWSLYVKDLVEFGMEFFLCHHVCVDSPCCSSGSLGRLACDMCAVCSTSGPLVLTSLHSDVGGSSDDGGVLDDLSSVCMGGSGGALFGDLSSLGMCSDSGGFLFWGLLHSGTCG